MFSQNHFIWLAICALLITGLLIAAKKMKFSFKCASYITASAALASELCKIFTHIEETTDKSGNVTGGILEPGALPFHLCSLLIFLIFFLAISGENKLTETVKSFIVPVAILGGTMALLIPTSGVDFAKPFAYQCFIYHSMIIWYSLYLIITGQVKLGLRSYLKNMGVLFCLVFVMLWVNSILSVYDTNFLYLVRPPMDDLPILNLNYGWHVYFLTLVSVALILFTLFHLPFIIRERGRKNKIK